MNSRLLVSALLALSGLSALPGCAAAPLAPRSAAVRGPREARLCLDGGGLRQGQRIRFERTVCERDRGDPDGAVCSLRPVAEGQVVRALDHRCAVLRVDGEADVRRGDQFVLGAAGKGGLRVALASARRSGDDPSATETRR